MESATNLSSSEIRLNAQQSALYRADTSVVKTLLGTAGEQAGKTTVGILWLRKEVEAYWKQAPFNYIVGANTYKVLKQSTKQKFDQLFTAALGHYHEKDDYFQMLKDGKHWGRIYFRSQGMDRKSAGDAFIGIPDCRAGLGDEVAKWQRQFYVRFKGRLGRLNGPFFGCGTPYALNFIKREIISPYEAGDTTLLYQRWSCMDNPSYDRAGIEELRKRYSKLEFDRLILGIVGKAEGMIHDGWDHLNWMEAFPIPREWTVVGGIDWGYNHPLALTVRAINPSGLCFGISFAKQVGLSTIQQLDLIEAKHKMFHVKIWGCGHDRPEQIDALKARGIPAVKYFEFKPEYREIRPGDAKLSELITRKRYRVFKNVDCADELEDEYQTYVWDANESDDDRKKEKAINDGHGHDLMAAERYATCVSLQFLTERKEKFQIPLNTKYFVDNFDPKTKTKRHWAQD